MARSVIDPRRLPATLSEATGLPLTGRSPHVKLPRTVCLQRMALDLDGEEVVLSTWPGELQDQARAFYGDPSRVDRLLDLTAAGPWSALPNGHLSYWLAAPERRWYFQHGSLDPAQYMHQWQEDLGEVRSHPRDDVATELWPWLLRRGYAGERDRPLMEDFVARAPRPDVHLRPGVWVARRWSPAEAHGLRERGELRRAVREAVDTMLDTLGEPPLGS